MPHFAKPFFRPKRKTWYVQINGTEHTLGRDKAEAYRLYHEMMARPPEEKPPEPKRTGLLVIEILDAFLDWCQKNKARRTYRELRALIEKAGGGDELRELIGATERSAGQIRGVRPNWPNSLMPSADA